jgi:hypothetical protein
MDNLTKKINEIKAYTEKATEGPWEIKEHDDNVTVELASAGPDTRPIARSTLGYVLPQLENDYRFIARSRTDLPLVTNIAQIATDALDKIAKGEPDAAIFAYMAMEKIVLEMAGGE